MCGDIVGIGAEIKCADPISAAVLRDGRHDFDVPVGGEPSSFDELRRKREWDVVELLVRGKNPIFGIEKAGDFDGGMDGHGI